MDYKGYLIRYGLAGAVTLSAGIVAGYEGLRLYAYRDPVGIVTICYGETAGVKMGDTKSKKECDDLLNSRVMEFMYQVRLLIKVPVTDERLAALTSFAYNIGINNFKSSTLLRKLNAGDTVGACNELSKWVYAKGVKLEGLVKRRESERLLCLK